MIRDIGGFDFLTKEEKINIKSMEVLKLPPGFYVSDNYRIQIVSIDVIEGGIAIFARAFNGSDQIGFGKDGTVDIERFKLFNPPVLVPDSNGSVVRSATNPITNETSTYRLKEDPVGAIIRSLDHTILVKKEKFGHENIITGKIGNTTSTFYPDAHVESTSVDGGVTRNLSLGSGESWGTIRGGAGNGAQDANSTGLDTYTISDNVSNQWRYLGRGIFLFDTSSIPDSDVISSATFSVFGSTVNGGKVDNFGLSVAVVDSTPASNTSLASSDYSNVGTTRYSDSDISITSWSNSAYNDWTLNSTGISNISKTGVTKFATRLDKDVDNSAPTWSSNIAGGIDNYCADQTGTSNDPKLVVEHAEALSTHRLLMMGVGI